MNQEKKTATEKHSKSTESTPSDSTKNVVNKTESAPQGAAKLETSAAKAAQKQNHPSPIADAKETDAKEKKAAKTKNHYWLAVVFVFCVVNFSAIGYLWINNTEQLSEQAKKNDDLEKQTQSMQEQLLQQATQVALLQTKKSEDLQQIQQKLENLQALSLTLQSQLNLTQQKINQTEGGVNQDLITSEADFLIRTASIRLLLTQNTEETSNLLKAADKKLLQINDVAIFPVRAALNKDLYQLKATADVDIIGTYLKLETLADSLKKVKINFILPQQTTTKAPQQDKTETWTEHLSNSTEEVINKWFQVTHYEQEIKPLLSLEQDRAIKQAMSLLVKQAQWALIQNNLELYQITLNNLSQEIRQAFNKSDPIVKAALVEIKSLISRSIVAPPPKYLSSEKAMKAYLESLENNGIAP